ncbi:hypothetical protein ACQ63I_001347 [Enterococcus faecalis]
MDVHKEKAMIYELMREIITERRELSKQYFDLKFRLDELKSIGSVNIKNKFIDSSSVIKEEKNKSQNMRIFSTNKKNKSISFERLASYVVKILKNSDIPLSNKQLFEILSSKDEVQIKYSNFTNNILPKIEQSKTFNAEKACRGFWQYRKRGE